MITYLLSKDNVTDAIYNEAKMAIIVLNVDGKIDSCNQYAKKLLGMDAKEKCHLGDLFEADEEQIERIMDGRKLSEHLLSHRTKISCSIRSVISRDTEKVLCLIDSERAASLSHNVSVSAFFSLSILDFNSSETGLRSDKNVKRVL